MNQEMSIEKGITCSYTPGIYAEGKQFSFFHLSVLTFVRSLLSIALVEFTSKFSVKVSPSGYNSPTTHQKAFIFDHGSLRGSASMP